MSYQTPITSSSITLSVFGVNDAVKEWRETMLDTIRELKKTRDVCISIQNGCVPTREDIHLLVGVCLKFHSSDKYYSYLEGSEDVDSIYVRALVFGILDSYVREKDVMDVLFGGSKLKHQEFLNLRFRTKGTISTCMRSVVNH